MLSVESVNHQSSFDEDSKWKKRTKVLVGVLLFVLILLVGLNIATLVQVRRLF